MAVKRAKTITKEQFLKLLKIVRDSPHALRDEVALHLSYYAGLRAGEIAKLRWSNNILDAEGNVDTEIHITSDVGKRSKERRIPLAPDTRALLKRLRKARPEAEYVFYALHNYDPPTERVVDPKTGAVTKTLPDGWEPGCVQPNAVVQWFKRLYAKADYEGCSSHSGRRTFITTRARLANLKKCSLRDVQEMVGHSRLDTTAGYIDLSEHQRDLVEGW